VQHWCRRPLDGGTIMTREQLAYKPVQRRHWQVAGVFWAALLMPSIVAASTTTSPPLPDTAPATIPTDIRAYTVSAYDGSGDDSSQPLTVNVIRADPTNYLGLLKNLRPGDTLFLEPGIYDDPNDVPGLPIFDLNGTPTQPIMITGPDRDPRPLFLGRSTHNTVRFSNASYIIIRNIEIDGRDLGGDGVNAQGTSYHITLENLLIHGVGSDQQVVGISTNGAPTWNWVIRNNIIMNAGTGMYLGNSDGTNPFVAGTIEYNLIVHTIGYNIQIKHQNPRPAIAGMPTEKSTTIIRHNVFSKANNASTGSNARPNLLVGHFPLSGPGMDDVYEIYGNFSYQNPSGEPLFQGEGNVALYNNLFFNSVGDAIWIQPHNDVPKTIRVFNNTVIASNMGIKVTGGSSAYTQKVIGNAVFATTPIQATDRKDNITDTYQNAENYLTNPTAPLGNFDLFPKPGKLTGSLIDASSFQSLFTDWNRDFNGILHNGTFRGAYAGEGRNPGWQPKLERKPPSVGDTVPPAAPTGLLAR
jgi:hypothetical protein